MRRKVLLFAVILSGLFSSAEVSALDVKGHLSGNQTWKAKHGPINIKGNVVIPEGSALKIEPGVEIIFHGYYQFMVKGALECVGTPQRQIVFTTCKRDPKPVLWKGLVLYGPKCSAVLSDCIVEYAFRNMCWKTSPTIRSVTFRYNSYGFYCSNTKTAMINKCRFQDNTHGIYCDYSSPTIQGNLITNNEIGIYCIFSSSPLVGQNTVEGNRTENIFLDDSMGENSITARNQYIWSLVRSIF